MLYQKNRFLLAAVVVLFMFAESIIVAQHKEKTGTLVGSAGRMDSAEGFIPLPDLKIVLVSKRGKQTIMSNENGDYVEELPPGEFCVDSITDASGKTYQILKGQNKCFTIKKKKVTRFATNVENEGT